MKIAIKHKNAFIKNAIILEISKIKNAKRMENVEIKNAKREENAEKNAKTFFA